MINKLKNRSRSSKFFSRSSNDQSEINQILDEGLYCTLAYMKKDRPFQISSGYCRMGDKLYIHSPSSDNCVKELLKAPEVCITVIIFDGLVVAPSALNHSVNYRGVVIHSKALEISGATQKASFFEAFTDKYVPGRMSDLKSPSSEEMADVTVLSFDFTEATSEIRSAPTVTKTGQSNVWSGVVPASVAYGIPKSDSGLKKGVGIPKYLTQMVVKSNV